jgi:hypothetical protein
MAQTGASPHRFLAAGTLRADIWAILAAFGAYFCMYMFRKPYTAASYESLEAFGYAFKPVAIVSQVLGYTISKFVGIRVVAEATRAQRVALYLGLIGIAEIALVLFGISPAPWSLFWLFVNGLPLGMVFGLVLAFLEGRTRTEFLTAGLCVSFVVADGVAKSLGVWLIGQGVPETMMPAASGMLFLPGIFLFGWKLSQIPLPSADDETQRGKREPMDRAMRQAFFRKFAVGIGLLVAVYSLVGVLRGIRGDFGPEIWKGLGTKVDPAVFSQTELIVAISVLLVMASLVFIKDNGKAFRSGLLLSGAGLLLIMLSLIGLQIKALPPYAFVVLTGVGLYIPYIAFHATIFERLIAFTKERGTIGYLMYLADATSYAGLVGLLLFKNFGSASAQQILPFFTNFAWFTAVSCLVMLIATWVYFDRRRAQA